MVRIFLIFLLIAAGAFAASWMADRPGTIALDWQGLEIEMSLAVAILALAGAVGLILLVWTVFRTVVSTPGAVGGFFRNRKQKKGMDALSRGMIAVGAGDKKDALKYSGQARKLMANQPLGLLLKAQAAQLAGDRETARRTFEAMLQTPETELLGLRGLFLEARRESEADAARNFAERAMGLNSALPWASSALLEFQSAEGDWEGALETLETRRRNKQIGKGDAKRQSAVILTAQAMAAEEQGNTGRALALAQEAHKIAPGLIPPAEIAGRLLAHKGETGRAARILEKTWKLAPHPDIALAHAHARPGDSAQDRLKRIKSLAQMTPHSVEGPIAVAAAAIEALDWEEARNALAPFLAERPQARICTLMARIENGEFGDKGRVREWLARAVRAPRDPAWTADGVVLQTWAPVSPVTGQLDAFEWKAPVEALGQRTDEDILEAFTAKEPDTAVPVAAVELAPADAEDTANDAPPLAQETSTADVKEAGEPAPEEAPGADETAPGNGARAGAGQDAPDQEAGAGKTQDSEPGEPEVFAPARAPDDPGPEREEKAKDKSLLSRLHLPS